MFLKLNFFSFIRKQFLLKLCHFTFQASLFRLQSFNRRSYLIFLLAQHRTNRSRIFLLNIIILQSTAATQHRNPFSTFIIHNINQLNKTYFSGLLRVRSTAGTNIIPRYRHNTHLTINFYFTAILHISKFLFSWISHKNVQILKYRFIGLFLNLFQFVF